MNTHAELATLEEEEPVWYELPEDAPELRAVNAKAQETSRVSRQNSYLEVVCDRNPHSTPPPESFVSDLSPDPSQVEPLSHPVSFSEPPLECQHRMPLRPLAVGQPTTSAVRVSSLPSQIVSSISSALHNASVTVGLRSSSTARDSQKTSSWSRGGNGVVMGAVPEGKK